MPQNVNDDGESSDFLKAARSIAAYIERSSHFFALCPIVQFDHAEVTCDYGSWLQRSGVRFELFTLLLSRRNRAPPIVR